MNQAVDELQHSISIEGAHISTKMLAHEIDLSAERNDLFANYWNYAESEIGNGDIFTFDGFSIGIIWWNNSVFVLDSHSL